MHSGIQTTGAAQSLGISSARTIGTLRPVDEAGSIVLIQANMKVNNMQTDDLLYGSHSGIQKAIRRGDLDLAKTSFDLMWPDAKHRNWLTWRALILVEEEMWWMLGEAAEFLHKKEKDEKDWRRFLYQLCLLPKSKDAEPLSLLAKGGGASEFKHPEMQEMAFWISRLDACGDLVLVADEMAEDIKDARYGKLTKYEMDAVRLLKYRTGAGGMYGDRLACLAAMLLIAMRRMRKVHVTKVIKKRLDSCKRLQKPKTVDLPWYVFDMHTAVGKMAMSIFMKHHAEKFGIEKEQLDNLWFCLESAQIPVDDLPVVRYSDDAKPPMLDSMWWPVWVKKHIQFGGLEPKQCIAKWKEEIRPEIQSIVSWCLEKRNQSS